MEKKQIAVVSLGDCRRPFYNTRAHIAEEETKKLIAKTARKYGKFAGTVGGPGNFDALVDMGYTFISCGADVVALFSYFQDLAGKIEGRDIKDVK